MMALLDPLGLVKLRETGRCFSQLPEGIVGIDLPGHYFRHIKIEPVIRHLQKDLSRPNYCEDFG